MANYLRKALFGAGYIFMFSMLAMVGGYLLRLVLARNLGPEMFGLFYAVFAFVVFVHNFHDPGLRHALIKFVAEFNVKKVYGKINRAISLTVYTWSALSAVLTILAVVFANFLAKAYFKSPDAFWPIIILSIGLALYSMDFFSYVFQGFQKMGLFASVDLVRTTVLLVAISIGFWFWPGNILVPSFAYVLVPLSMFAVYLPVLKARVFPQFKFVPRFDQKLLKKMVRFGLPVVLTAMSYALFQQVSVLVLTYYGTLKEVGWFNIALPTAGLLMSISSALVHVVLPMASELWARGYTKHLQEGVDLLYRYTFIAILPISLMLFSFAPLIVTTLFGEEYANAAPALMVLAIGTLFWVIANINFNFLAGIGKSKEPFKIMLWVGLASLVLNFALIYALTLIGAAWALALSYLLAMILSIVVLRRHVRVHVPLLFWVKNAFVAGVFLGAVYWLKDVLVIANPYVEAIITLVGAGLVYVAFLFLLRMTSWKELMTYLRRVLKKH